MAKNKDKDKGPFSLPFIEGAAGMDEIIVFPPVSTGNEIPIVPNAGSARVPTYKEPTPKPGSKLPGSDDRRTGEGAKDSAPDKESVSGF